MESWIEVKTKKNIDELMSYFHGFHDSCISSIRYVTGNQVSDNKSMKFGELNDYEAIVIFESQWGGPIELCFNGVRRMHLVGMEDNYFPDISGATIIFANNILPCKFNLPKETIVWANDAYFDIKYIDNALTEPSITYIIAHQLKWRKLKD